MRGDRQDLLRARTEAPRIAGQQPQEAEALGGIRDAFGQPELEQVLFGVGGWVGG